MALVLVDVRRNRVIVETEVCAKRHTIIEFLLKLQKNLRNLALPIFLAKNLDANARFLNCLPNWNFACTYKHEIPPRFYVRHLCSEASYLLKDNHGGSSARRNFSVDRGPAGLGSSRGHRVGVQGSPSDS